VHSKHAYAAGFGTAGALLAGCAVLFVLASTLVGFHGWPSLSGPSSPSHLTIDAGPVRGGAVATRATRRLQALTAAPAARRAIAGTTATSRAGLSAGSGGSPAGHAGLRPGGQRTGGTTQPGTGSGSGTHNGPPILNHPVPRPPITCTHDCGGGGGPPDGGVTVVDKIRQAAANTVSRTGSALGGEVQKVTGEVPSAGGVLAKAGAAAGGAISGTAGAVGSVLGAG
jgi:hypothetical protein